MTRLGVLPAETLEGWVLNLADVVAAHADVFDQAAKEVSTERAPGLREMATTARTLAAFYKGQLSTPVPNGPGGQP